MTPVEKWPYPDAKGHRFKPTLVYPETCRFCGKDIFEHDEVYIEDLTGPEPPAPDDTEPWTALPLLTRQSLDQARCITPGCDHENDDRIHLRPSCHDASVWITYYKSRGALHAICSECGRTVAAVQVAKEEGL